MCWPTAVLLKVKQGCGTYVRDLSTKDAVAPLSLLLKMQKCPDTAERLTEVRRTIEIAIAGLAAERASDDDLAILRAHLVQMRATDDQPEEYAKHDLGFHLALGKATCNPYFNLLIEALAGLLSETIMLTLILPKATEAGINHHQHLLAAIEARDPEAARQAMRGPSGHIE